MIAANSLLVDRVISRKEEMLCRALQLRGTVF